MIPAPSTLPKRIKYIHPNNSSFEQEQPQKLAKNDAPLDDPPKNETPEPCGASVVVALHDLDSFGETKKNESW